MTSSTDAPPASATSAAPPERHRPAWRLIAIEFAAALYLRPDLGEARANLEQLDHDR